jgi:hypothetical protein
VADGSSRPRPSRVFLIGGVVIAAVFVIAFAYLLVRRSWVGAAIVLPFAAAQTYFAIAAAQGSNLGYRR